MKLWHQLLFGVLLIWFGATIPIYCFFAYRIDRLQTEKIDLKAELIGVRWDLSQLKGKVKNAPVKPSSKKIPQKSISPAHP